MGGIQFCWWNRLETTDIHIHRASLLCKLDNGHERVSILF